MKKFRVLAAALAASAMLAACGGSGPGDQTPRVTYGKMVNFGDSLSDVGTYRVSFVAVSGGGEYSINGVATYTNWTEYLAAQLGLTAPCAAETGLNTIEAIVGFPPVPATFHNTGAAPCYDYAQGGARVTNPIGPGNAALVNPADPNTYSNAIGQLTVPVTTQIDNHLAVQPTFAADDLVTVFAGGNDLFINLATFSATVAAGGDPNAAAQSAVGAMVQAADDLAGYVQNKILANGATHVVLINLPDVSLTPMGLENAAAQPLILQMTQAFNGELATKLPASDAILFVDAFTTSQQQAAAPAQFGLTNVTDPACDLTKAASSLLCTKLTLINADVTFYEYADTVHPTPYGYRLLSQLVTQQMAIKGWL
jgi:phospholipase/lecithinase/hemolysin